VRGFNGTEAAGTESPTVKESRRYINLANAMEGRRLSRPRHCKKQSITVTNKHRTRFLFKRPIFPELLQVSELSGTAVAEVLQAGCPSNHPTKSKTVITTVISKLEEAAQGVAQCEVSTYAPSCRRCVATY